MNPVRSKFPISYKVEVEIHLWGYQPNGDINLRLLTTRVIKHGESEDPAMLTAEDLWLDIDRYPACDYTGKIAMPGDEEYIYYLVFTKDGIVQRIRLTPTEIDSGEPEDWDEEGLYDPLCTHEGAVEDLKHKIVFCPDCGDSWPISA